MKKHLDLSSLKAGRVNKQGGRKTYHIISHHITSYSKSTIQIYIIFNQIEAGSKMTKRKTSRIEKKEDDDEELDEKKSFSTKLSST